MSRRSQNVRSIEDDSKIETMSLSYKICGADFFPTTMTYLCECVGMYVCVVCLCLYVCAGTHVRVCACVGACVRPSVRVCVLVRMYIGVTVTTI